LQLLEQLLSDDVFVAGVGRAGSVMSEALNAGNKIISCGN
jgi:phosphoheptose isomerase